MKFVINNLKYDTDKMELISEKCKHFYKAIFWGTEMCIYLLIGFPKWSCNAALIIIHWFIMLASFLCVLYILGRGIML